MIDISSVLVTLAISMAVQTVFFAFAASLETDKVTDLSYGLTFIILAIVLLAQHDPHSRTQCVAALLVVAWGVRLASYLLYRIVHITRDPRFDGVREHFWKFFQFWFFQGVVVWIVMLPTTVWFAKPGPWSTMKAASVTLWAVGLSIETVADIQKFRQKSGGTSRWMDSGLWHYSRHPNYFGELLCWWSVFAFVAPDLEGWAWASLAGPLTLTYILLFVTGIPTLEQSADKKWGRDAAYQAYKRETSVLVPWFK